MELTAKIIISVIAVALAIGPMTADFNKTHATNPLWTPHARFHVVWQVLSHTGMSIIALYLLWGAPSTEHNFIALGINYVWFISFYMTLSTMKMFDGSLADVNGIKPFVFNLPGGKVWTVDTNLFGGTILLMINTIAFWLLLNA